MYDAVSGRGMALFSVIVALLSHAPCGASVAVVVVVVDHVLRTHAPPPPPVGRSNVRFTT